MGEDLLTQVGSYERWTRVCERLREIMSVCVCLRVLGGLSGAGFAGFIRIFRMGEDLLTQVGSYERWTRVCERLREIMSVCVCLRVLGGLSGAGFAGFFGIFGMGGPAGTGALVRALEESLRAFTRDHERLRVFTWVGRIVWSRICRIFWDFQDGGGPADAGGLVRALDERLRVFTCVGWVVWSRICRIFWDFRDGGGPAGTGALVRALDESLRAFTRDHERLRVSTSVGRVV